MSEKKFKNFMDVVKKGDAFVAFAVSGRMTKKGVKTGTFQKNGMEEMYANGSIIINGQGKTLNWLHEATKAEKDLFSIGKDGDDAYSLSFSCFGKKEVEKLKEAAPSALITVQGFFGVNANGELYIDVHKVLDIKAPKNNAGVAPVPAPTPEVASAVEDAAKEEAMEEINPADLPFDSWY